jgi:curved DNA-binding protein CbpA
MHVDPWRILGLAPGASQDEIRRAYRRLAKANHPDAAGDAALPRFLAIQAAYDQLAGSQARPLGRRGAARPSNPDPRDPWQADPDRARASGRADGRRAPGARPGGGRAGPAGTTGRPGAGGAAGRSGASSDRGPEADPSGSTPSGEGAGSRARRSSSRRRPSNRATPGSTSYEGADEEPFEPGWSGATWYGASSGTYWTINPKEYADPRKHGPEYQARARRSTAGRMSAGASAPSDAEAQDDATASRGPSPEAGGARDEPAADRGPDGATPGARAPRGRPSPTPDSWTFASAADEAAAAPTSPGSAGASRRDRTRERPEANAEPLGGADGMPGDAGRSPSRAEGPADPDEPRSATPGDVRRARGPVGEPPRRPTLDDLRASFEEPEGRVRVPLLREPTTPLGRLAMALAGWPPLGIFVGVAIADSTGCGRYAASCAELSAPGTWLVNAVLVLLLLAIPRLAAWSAHGTIVALVAGIPTAVALSAGGGSNVPEASAPVLLTVLAVAYLGGVAYAVIRRLQLGASRVPPSRPGSPRTMTR